MIHFLLSGFMATQIFRVLLFIAFFISEILALNIDTRYALIALLGAVGGGIVLTYFERIATLADRLVKIIIASISSLFISPALIKYYGIESLEYDALIFFLMSLLSVFILKALIAVTKQNASDIFINVFTRVFNVQVNRQERFNNKIKETKQ